MRTLKSLKPSQKGAGDLLARQRAGLLPVRCCSGEAGRERLKTTDLVVERCRRAAGGLGGRQIGHGGWLCAWIGGENLRHDVAEGLDLVDRVEAGGSYI